LPIAGGSFCAAFTQGRLIDWSYAREAKKLGIKVVKARQQDLTNFPIEKARLLVAIPMLLSSSLFTIAYGWVLHYRTHIAGPCVFLFFMGYTLIASTQSISVLIVDINPGIAGTATAAFNLIRCLLGAGATALILPMIDTMGTGWAYTLIGLIYIALSPMLLIVIKFGPGWRRTRWEAQKKKKAEKQERKNALEVAEKV
jgi:sugar phosphate permease